MPTDLCTPHIPRAAPYSGWHHNHQAFSSRHLDSLLSRLQALVLAAPSKLSPRDSPPHKVSPKGTKRTPLWLGALFSHLEIGTRRGQPQPLQGPQALLGLVLEGLMVCQVVELVELAQKTAQVPGAMGTQGREPDCPER